MPFTTEQTQLAVMIDTHVTHMLANGGGDEVWDDQSQQQGQRAKKPGNRRRDQHMEQECEDAIRVFPRVIQRRIKTHPVKENENVTK